MTLTAIENFITNEAQNAKHYEKIVQLENSLLEKEQHQDKLLDSIMNDFTERVRTGLIENNQTIEIQTETKLVQVKIEDFQCTEITFIEKPTNGLGNNNFRVHGNGLVVVA